MPRRIDYGDEKENLEKLYVNRFPCGKAAVTMEPDAYKKHLYLAQNHNIFASRELIVILKNMSVTSATTTTIYQQNESLYLADYELRTYGDWGVHGEFWLRIYLIAMTKFSFLSRSTSLVAKKLESELKMKSGWVTYSSMFDAYINVVANQLEYQGHLSLDLIKIIFSFL